MSHKHANLQPLQAVKIVQTNHAGIHPGSIGSIEHAMPDGYAVKIDVHTFGGQVHEEIIYFNYDQIIPIPGASRVPEPVIASNNPIEEKDPVIAAYLKNAHTENDIRSIAQQDKKAWQARYELEKQDLLGDRTERNLPAHIQALLIRDRVMQRGEANTQDVIDILNLLHRKFHE